MTGVWLFAFVVLWVLVLIEAFFLFVTLRQLGLLSARVPPPRPQGLAVGTPAPAFALPDLAGHTVSLPQPPMERAMLAFVSPSCPACKPLLPALSAFSGMRDGSGPLVQVICQATAEDCQRMAAEHALRLPVLVDTDGATGQAYQTPGVPHLVMIDGKGEIVKNGYARDLEELRRFADAPADETVRAPGAGKGGLEPVSAGSTAARKPVGENVGV